MNSALPFAPAAAADPKLLARPFWLATLAWVGACLAGATIAAASVPVASWSRASAAPTAPALVRTALESVNPRTSTRCQTCGVVEIVRKLQGVGAAPAAYELTVRLRDGTHRISSHSGPAGWRVGDSIMLIGDAPRPVRS